MQAAVGTVPYMAPEQLQEHPRPASDQYALGMVVYEWLCGDRPFSGSFTEIAMKHLSISPPPLRAKVSTISPEIEQVVMTVLAKDYKQRFASVRAYQGHSESVNSVSWSPDGKRIAAGSFDKTVQVWDAADGSHVYTYPGHTDDVNVVAWSPDGKRIASASRDRIVQVWDAVGGSHVYTYQGHSDSVIALAWSPNSKRIVSAGDDGTAQVWDAADAWYRDPTNNFDRLFREWRGRI
jgi:WD40 repeat protein